LWARPEQLPPLGHWYTWLALAGRGWGKSRVGSEWVNGLARKGKPKKLGIALVAPTWDDGKDIMVNGESGIIACSHPHFRPIWKDRELTWPNGEWARLYSADRPDRLRGKQHAYAWGDELASWRYKDAYDQLQFTLRLGESPQTLLTTTPRPIAIIRELIAESKAQNNRGDVRIVRGSTYDNKLNLSAKFIQAIEKRFGGTRLGRQEIHAHVLDDNPGALWQRSQIDKDRIKPPAGCFYDDSDTGFLNPEVLRTKLNLTRVVVAIDPAVSTNEESDETGIVVVGADRNGHGYLLEDLSGVYTPTQWALCAVRAYTRWGANLIVAEINNGGNLVEANLKTVEGGNLARYEAVHASKGKFTRAEPVSSLCEQHRIHHVGSFPGLEDQLCDWNPQISDSPDRLDAYVWGFTLLLVRGQSMLDALRKRREGK
jgi:phage terminase large subunit-like protein